MAKKKYLIIAAALISLTLAACGNNSSTSKKEVAQIKLQDTSFLDEMERKPVKLEFKKSDIKPQVPDYNVEDDLSNVENLKDFGEFSDEQKKDLAKNGFMIARTKKIVIYEGHDEYQYDQIHQIYEDNEYKAIPSFVTTDSVTHIFHIFYDNFLRNLEKDELYPELKEFNQNLLATNIDIYNHMENTYLKELQLKNIAFLAAGAKLSDVEMVETPKEAEDLINREIQNIKNETPTESEITKHKVDYSQLKPRGHYTRSEDLEKYFKNTMYFGQMGFFPEAEGGYDKDILLQSLLLTYSIYNNENTLKSWESLVGPMDFLVESADDLSVREYARILYGVYGKDLDINKLDDLDKLDMAYAEIEKLEEPQIAGFMGKSFRLIPQRRVLDNVFMQNTVDIAKDGHPSDRPIYSGLDLMSTFDNKRAREIQKNDSYNHKWAEYQDRIDENIKAFKAMKDEDWQKNLYRGWLWMLSSYSNEYEEGYPMFMRNEAWQKKDLVSALGSYAELKHDTILYGKSVMAEMGGGMEPDLKSYVEPNLDLYEKLSWLIDYTKLNLKDREILSEKNEEKLDNFKEMVDLLITCSKKELNNETLTDEEYQSLQFIGGWMESLMVDFVESDDKYGVSHWFEISNPEDRRMPVVADLMRVVENSVGLPEGEIFSIATGKPAEIYVIYPIDGKLVMGRGGIFTYYEFLDENRLNDKEWQSMVFKDEKDYPAWYKDLVREPKAEFEGGDLGEWWEDGIFLSKFPTKPFMLYNNRKKRSWWYVIRFSKKETKY